MLLGCIFLATRTERAAVLEHNKFATQSSMRTHTNLNKAIRTNHTKNWNRSWINGLVYNFSIHEQAMNSTIQSRVSRIWWDTVVSLLPGKGQTRCQGLTSKQPYQWLANPAHFVNDQDANKNKFFQQYFCLLLFDTVVDPDPYVLGSPGSGSFHHQAK